MMFPGNIKVYIALGNVDMRKAIDGLSAMVSGIMRLDVFAGRQAGKMCYRLGNAN